MPASFPVIGDIDCIAIEGADARRFAQAQFSGDVHALAPLRWQWNAWMTAQGRVQALMHLVDPGNGSLLAVLRGGNAELVRAGLAHFLMRMRVTLSPRTFSGVAQGPLPSGTVEVESDGSIVLGYGTRSLALVSGPATLDVTAQSAWRGEDIRQGMPTLPDGAPEFLPPALGLEHLGAVSFDKGCYPGQEIAARLHYRGGHKYRLCHIRGSAGLSMGAVRNGNSAPIAWVLDSVTAEATTNALVVAGESNALEINILGLTYSIISRFEA